MVKKTTGVALLFVGVICLYLAVVGPVFPTLFTLTGSFFKEDWNSIDANVWGNSGYTLASYYISPAGQLQMSTLSTGGGDYRAWLNHTFPTNNLLPASYSVESRVCVDSWGMSGGKFYLDTYTPVHTEIVEIRQNEVGYLASSGQYQYFQLTTAAGTWYTWTISIDENANGGAGKVTVMRDGTTVFTLNQLFNVASGGLPDDVVICMMSDSGATQVHIDYIYIDSATTNPATGDLAVIGSFGGSAVSFTNAYYVGPTGASASISVPATGYTWSSVPVGSYTVTGTYGSTTVTSPSVQVTNGGTVTASINFGSGGGSSTGSLQVNAQYYDGTNWQTCSVFASVTGQSSENTPYTWTLDSSGSYTVTVPTTYSGYPFKQWSDGSTANPRSGVTVPNGGTTTLYAQYYNNGNPGGGGAPTDYWAQIIGFFKDPTVRTMLLLMGAGFSSLGVIILVYKPKSLRLPSTPKLS